MSSLDSYEFPRVLASVSKLRSYLVDVVPCSTLHIGDTPGRRIWGCWTGSRSIFLRAVMASGLDDMRVQGVCLTATTPLLILENVLSRARPPWVHAMSSCGCPFTEGLERLQA